MAVVLFGITFNLTPRQVQDVMTKGVHRVYADDDLNIAEKVMKVSSYTFPEIFLTWVAGASDSSSLRV